MPEMTPIYEFPYPCQGEVVAPSDFADLANAIDAKLLDLSGQESAALHRATFREESPSDTASAGVVDVPAVSYVTTEDGIYMVSAWLRPSAFGGDRDGIRVRVRLNSTAEFGSTRNMEDQQTFSNITTGVLIAASGDTIDTDVLLTGTSTMTYTVNLDIKLIVSIA